MKMVTRAESQALDSMAIERYGVSEAALMENAGRALAALVDRRFSGRAHRRLGGTVKRAVIFCGHGNNGGDGLVAARHLLNWGWRVQIFLSVSPDRLRGEPSRQYDTMRQAGTEIESVTDGNLTRVRLAAGMCDVVIDALLGTGLKGSLREPYGRLIELVRSLDVPVVAADIPSGLDADTGFPVGDAVRATLTVTFGLPKVGLALYPGADLAGEVVVADIGLPRPALEGIDTGVFWLQHEGVQRLLPRRSVDTHKGEQGRVLVVAGSGRMAGAAILCGRGALRGGAGLVTIAVPESVQPTVASGVPEALTVGLPEVNGGRASDDARSGPAAVGPAAVREILTLAEDADAVVLGPGLSRHEGTAEAVAELLREIQKPIVIDADALNIAAGLPGWGFGGRGAARGRSGDGDAVSDRRLLTPHPGEMGRLLGKSADEVQRDRLGAVREAAVRGTATVVLKGAHTVIGRPDGVAAVNPTGNPGLAVGGSGDVLAGLLGAFTGRGLPAWEAALAGVYAHGSAGDYVAAHKGVDGMGAADVAEALPASLIRLREAEPRAARGGETGRGDESGIGCSPPPPFGEPLTRRLGERMSFEPAAYRSVASEVGAGPKEG